MQFYLAHGLVVFNLQTVRWKRLATFFFFLKNWFHKKLLTSCKNVFFEKLTVSHLVKRSTLVVWFITLFTTSATSPSPDTDIYFCNIQSIIIIPSVFRSYKRPLTFRFFKHNPCPIFVFSMHKIRPAPFIILHVATQIISDEEFRTVARVWKLRANPCLTNM